LLKKRGHLEVFTSVIYALFLREVNVRFSAGTLGYFWVIFEPLIQISSICSCKTCPLWSKSNFWLCHIS